MGKYDMAISAADLDDYDWDDVSPWGANPLEQVGHPNKNAFSQLSALLQKARHDHNVLDQGDVWVNAGGMKVQLSEISARYAINILSSLRQRARLYHIAWATWEFITKYADRDVTDVEELIENNITEAKAREWIKQTKLYLALVDISKQPV